MIEFSCADFTFPVLSHEKALALIAMMDFEWVDIGLFTDRSHIRPVDQFLNPEKSGIALRRKAEATGLSISDVFLQSATDHRERAINHPDPSIRKAERDVFRRLVEYALGAGCKHVTGLPGADYGGNSHEICVEELLWRVLYARDNDLVYAVEPHLDSIMGTPDQAMWMLNACEGLTLTLDHSHYIRQGFSIGDVNPLLRYASHMHARGAALGHMQTSVAENETDFALVASGLTEIHYSGKWCLEYCWLDWENCNRTDNVSETLLLRDLLRIFLRS